MPDTPLPQVPPGHPHPGPAAQPISHGRWTPPPPRAFHRASRWLSFAALAIALIGVVIGVVGWFRPVPHNSPPLAPPNPTFSDKQIGDAKTHVCAAYGLVHDAVIINTHRSNPAPGDAIGALAVAANGRLALYAGGDYLLGRLAMEPAAPPDLVAAVRSLANRSEELGMVFLADKPDSIQNPLRQDLDADVATIDRLCK